MPVNDIIKQVLNEGFVRKNGMKVTKSNVLSAMYRLCAWYIPSKGKLKEQRKGVMPAHGQLRRSYTRQYIKQSDPKRIVIPTEWKIVGIVVVAITVVVVAAILIGGR